MVDMNFLITATTTTIIKTIIIIIIIIRKPFNRYRYYYAKDHFLFCPMLHLSGFVNHLLNPVNYRTHFMLNICRQCDFYQRRGAPRMETYFEIFVMEVLSLRFRLDSGGVRHRRPSATEPIRHKTQNSLSPFVTNGWAYWPHTIVVTSFRLKYSYCHLTSAFLVNDFVGFLLILKKRK